MIFFSFFLFYFRAVTPHMRLAEKKFFYPDFFFYEAPCVILGGARWWNRFLGISSPAVGNLQSVKRCSRNVIWSAGAAAVSRTAAAAATHDGFPSGAAARPISGILNNIPQQRLLWVSISIQNAVFEAWEMCRYLRWGGASRDPDEALWWPRPSVHSTAQDMFAANDRVQGKVQAGFECCQTHKSPWGCILANHSPGFFRLSLLESLSSLQYQTLVWTCCCFNYYLLQSFLISLVSIKTITIVLLLNCFHYVFVYLFSYLNLFKLFK